MNAIEPSPSFVFHTGTHCAIDPRADAAISENSISASKLKGTAAWQASLWQRWPREECWPAKMDVYEAAAYLRVSPDTIRRAVIVARDGKAKLAHQRLGSVYRFRKAALDAVGSVPGRAPRC